MFSRLIKTKTFWAGISGIAVGIGQITTGDVPGGLQSIVVGLGIIFLRDATAKIPTA